MMLSPILKSRISNIKARVPITIPLIIAEGKKNQNIIILIMSRPTALQAIIVRIRAGIYARRIANIDRRAAIMSAEMIPRLNAQTTIQIRVKPRSMVPLFCSVFAKPIAIPIIALALPFRGLFANLAYVYRVLHRWRIAFHRVLAVGNCCSWIIIPMI